MEKIQSQSLRIGNKVRFTSEGIDFTVLEISRNGLTVENKTETVWIEIDQFEGIPLTEDILVKAGFTGGKGEGFGLDIIELDYITTEDNLQLELKIAGGSERWFIIDVKFVHELQNLFKVLTGKELTIEL